MQLGINTMVWSGRFTAADLPLLDRLRAWGYSAVEFPVFDFVNFDCAMARRAAADAGLALTLSSAMPSNLHIGSDDPSLRRRTCDWLAHALERTADCGARLLCGPMYAPVGYLPGRRRTDVEWAHAVESLRTLGSMIEGLPVRLAIEPLNRFETYFLNTAAEARALCEASASPSIGVLFDTFHSNIEEASFDDALDALGPRLFHVHLSENNRGVPGDGHIPFGQIVASLHRRGYDGLAVVESFASTIPEIAAATAMWRDYAASPDEFARRAAGHLLPLLRRHLS
jgi:D-psicose/D-tagatose/L-ribulose 3-epimerase